MSCRAGATALVRLSVGNTTSRDVRLTQLVVQQGLRGDVRAPGDVSLPLDLPPREPGGEVTTVLPADLDVPEIDGLVSDVC